MESKFLKIICPRCRNQQTIFGKASVSVKCDKCNRLLVKNTGGKTRVRAPIQEVINDKPERI